jgi:transglutaminase-like putative cysteine protease
MTRHEIVHTTRFVYDARVAETHMEIRERPLDGLGQRCLDFNLSVRPRADVRSYRDGFGNTVHYFDQLTSHDRIEVTARSLVETGLQDEDTGGEEFPEDYLQFRNPVLDVPGVRRLVNGSAASEEVLDALASRIHGQFEYVPLSTTVSTAVDEVLRLGSGVCQDFAHLFLAAARSLGVPCRYVSGYVQPGGDRVGAGATHAWAEAWVGGRWIGYDPTNPVRAGADHIRVAIGKDYNDVPPTRGVFVGSAHETMEVTVVVRSV